MIYIYDIKNCKKDKHYLNPKITYHIVSFEDDVNGYIETHYSIFRSQNQYVTRKQTKGYYIYEDICPITKRQRNIFELLVCSERLFLNYDLYLYE